MFAKLFQWDEFLTPVLIRLFFLLAVAMAVVGGLFGLFNAFALMAYSFFGGLTALIFSLLGVVIGVIFARMAAEMVLIAFKINDNLETIRNRGDEM